MKTLMSCGSVPAGLRPRPVLMAGRARHVRFLARDLRETRADWVPGAGRARRRGEHLKRPDGFLRRDGDGLRQSAPDAEASGRGMRLFLHNGSGGGERGRESHRQDCDWKVSAVKPNACSCFLKLWLSWCPGARHS